MKSYRIKLDLVSCKQHLRIPYVKITNNNQESLHHIICALVAHKVVRQTGADTCHKYKVKPVSQFELQFELSKNVWPTVKETSCHCCHILLVALSDLLLRSE